MDPKITRHRLGDFKLQSGEKLKNAEIVFATYGHLNQDKSNAVLMPTYYAGTHKDNEAFFGYGRALDPQKHCIIVPNLFGNGLSSSPSRSIPGISPRLFPQTTFYDNVVCQHDIITKHFGIEKFQLIAGFSMGGCQSLQWGVQYPDMAGAILACCTSTKTSIHNYTFLEGVKAALLTDPAFLNGDYQSQPEAGLEAFGRVWCGWAYSHGFFRNETFRQLGYETLDDLLAGWEKMHIVLDANNLLHMLHTWQAGDVGANPIYQGDTEKALASITAPTILMPSSTDMYFRVQDNLEESQKIPRAEVRIHETEWGHCCINDTTPPTFQQSFDQAVRDLLSAEI